MNRGKSPLQIAFAEFMPAIRATIVFSVACNLLMFVGPLYMLQIYDRVLSSRNESTLVALTIIAAFLIFAYALLDYIRSRVMVRAGAKFDETLNGPLFHAVMRAALSNRNGSAVQTLRDMDAVREFWTGAPVITLCDAPFAPVFVAVCFFMHTYLGLVALVGALIMFALALANERLTKPGLAEAGKASRGANYFATTTVRNVEVVQALGMREAMHKKWLGLHEALLGWQAQASDRSGIIMAINKGTRTFLQSAILGMGAYLALQSEITPGSMIAASIMMGRALQPVEQAVAQWKSFLGARGSWTRLQELFQSQESTERATALPEPTGELTVENVIVTAVGRKTPILKGLSFHVPAGQVLAIVGPSASGKSTLARTLVGVWPLSHGVVRLDNNDIRHWDPDELGKYVGYLPQDVELFEGTISENIARFGDHDSQNIIRAAELAGVHPIIQHLPDGYDTQIGEAGSVLSGGQRQRLGLARALYGGTKVVVLDEPNSHLDAAGENELSQSLMRIKAMGTTIVVITHKPNLLSIADRLIVMNEGAIQYSGPTEEVLKKLAAASAPKVVPKATVEGSVVRA